MTDETISPDPDPFELKPDPFELKPNPFELNPDECLQFNPDDFIEIDSSNDLMAIGEVESHSHGESPENPVSGEQSDSLPGLPEELAEFMDLEESCKKQKVLTVRMHSGLAGDMFLCGLLRMLDYKQEQIDELLCGIFPKLTGTVKLTRKSVNNIGGWFCEVDLPHEHEHRNLQDVLDIISTAQMSEKAKKLAGRTFEIVAQAEATVHSLPVAEVHFHEVGALDSILDICFTCELYSRLAPDILVVSPLPIADGQISCAHGIIPCPAPAVQALLPGMQVRPFQAHGETVTPTAVALLKALNPQFGNWPRMLVEKIDTIYGTYEYPGVPNGATFAFGTLI